MLRKNPEERIGASDIEEIKNHQYFKSIDFVTIKTSQVPYRPAQVVRTPLHSSFVSNNQDLNSYYNCRKDVKSTNDMSIDRLGDDDAKFSDISYSELNGNKNLSNNGDNSFEIDDKLNKKSH